MAKHAKKRSLKDSKFVKDGNLVVLIPAAVLLIFALLSWSWVLLLSPNISNAAGPYISRYLSSLMQERQKSISAETTGAQDSDTSGVDTDTGPQNQGQDSTGNNSGQDKDPASTEKEEARPTIKLQVYEGPKYNSADDTCYYRIRAVVTGNPKPDVQFSRDDSAGALGPGTCQVNLKRNAKTYTLTATASNIHGTVMDSIYISWGCNVAPVISQLNLSSDIVYTGMQYDITVVAADPDGDAISYKWSVSGGTLDRDNEPTVKWTAPQAAGDYEVKVEVSDSKGAKTTRAVAVYVGTLEIPQTTAPPTTAPPPTTASPTTSEPTEPQPVTVNLPKITGEGGYLEYDSQTYAGSNVYAGDSADNKPCAGFISFDITSLAGKSIQSATLAFTSATVHSNPMSYADALWINVVEWGARPIVQNDFNLIGIAIQSFTNPAITCNAASLKSELQKAINAGKTRLQIRVHFAGPYSNNDGIRDGWEYQQQNINLSATY